MSQVPYANYFGQVANPNDILLWSKSAVRKAKEPAAGAPGEGVPQGLRPEALDQVGCNMHVQLEFLTACCKGF